MVALALLGGCAPVGTEQNTATPAPPTATPVAPADAGDAVWILNVTGAVEHPSAWSEADLRALGSSEVDFTDKDGETTTHVGVSFAELLAEVGVAADATTLVLGASDGYQAQAPLADVLACADCIVGFQEAGGFRVVMPGFPGNVQVRDLIEIQALTDAEAMPGSGGSGDTSSEAALPNDGPITLTDAAGRTVDLERLPRRIVVVGRGPYMTLHLLYMFPEARQRLVGAEAKSATASDFLPIVDPGFAEVPTMAANPNPEQIASLAPDVVLMKSTALDEMGSSLAEIGIPVIYTGLETPEQFYQDVTNVGLLLGNPDRAREIIAFYQDRLDRIDRAIAGVPEEERPRVLLVEYSDRGGEVAVQVPAVSWMQTIQVQAAGGAPVWVGDVQLTDGWTVTNFEQIAAWDPDKIFVVIWYTMDLQEVIDGLKGDPQWSQLAAVQNGELYAYPADLYGWDTPEPRWILGVTWLAKRTHPEPMADVDLNEEMYAFFGELYGLERAVVEAEILPRVHLDVR